MKELLAVGCASIPTYSGMVPEADPHRGFCDLTWSWADGEGH